MTVTRTSSGRLSTQASACALAASRRLGTTSIAAILAEVSNTRIAACPATPSAQVKGRARAKMSAARMSSCRISSTLRRSRCQGALASTSRTMRRQR
jgi:hypothetical protein